LLDTATSPEAGRGGARSPGRAAGSSTNRRCGWPRAWGSATRHR
jgi:hypothetical protein